MANNTTKQKIKLKKRNQINRLMCVDRFFRTRIVEDKRRKIKHKIDYKKQLNNAC